MKKINFASRKINVIVSRKEMSTYNKFHEQKLARNKLHEQNELRGKKFIVQLSQREKNKMQQISRIKIGMQ